MRVFSEEVGDYEKIFVQDGGERKMYKRYFRYDKIEKPVNFDNIVEFRDTFNVFLKKASNESWYNSVCLKWLIANFKVKGKDGILSFKASVNVFNVWIRESVGINYDFLYQSFTYKALSTYFDEIFPDFQKENPFKDPPLYDFPFKFITVDYLMFVYQIPERMALLKQAEQQHMSFNAFADFVINYTSKCNFVDDEEKYYFKRNESLSQIASFIKNKEYGKETK